MSVELKKNIGDDFMKITTEFYNLVKSELKAEDCNTRYFTKDFLNHYFEERRKAAELFANGGDMIKFWNENPITETDFYNKNSCAFCVMLEILHSLRKRYIVVFVSECGGEWQTEEKADNSEIAAIQAMGKFKNEFPTFVDFYKIKEIRQI